MNEITIGLIICNVLGVIFIVIGLFDIFFEKNKKKSCTAVIYGQVIGYSYINDSPAPVVEYNVEGINYKKRKCFRSVITVQRGLLNSNPSDNTMYVDDNDVLHINRGCIVNFRPLVEKLYPMGSILKVYYNPKKPKQAYVERIPKKSSIFGILFFSCGFIIILIGNIIMMLVK